MRPLTAAFAAAVKESGQTALSRVSLLRADLSVDEEITGEGGVAIAGSVSTDTSRRRTCSLSIANPSGAWTPAVPGDPLYLNRLIRVERGLIVAGKPEYATLGTFLVDRPQTVVDKGGSTLSVGGQDRTKLSAKSAFTKPETYWAGTPLASVVRSIAAAAGMGQALYRLDDAGKALLADRTFDPGLYRWPALLSLVGDYSLNAYVDADGYLVLTPAMTDATIPPAVWTFARGTEAVMLGITKDLTDDRLYNHTLASAEGSNLAPVSAEARDLNPASPAYNPIDGTGPIGDRLLTFSSAQIRDHDQAQEKADVLLLENALLEEAITVPSVVHPGIEAGDVVEVVEALSRTDDTYIVDTMTVPLGVSEAMTFTSRRVRSLAA